MSNLVNADELERRLDAAVVRVDAAAEELHSAQAVLQALLAIRGSLDALDAANGAESEGDIGSPQARVVVDGSSQRVGEAFVSKFIRERGSNLFVVRDGSTGQFLVKDGGPATSYTVDSPAPKKVRSTGMVVDIVNEADGSLSVDEVLERFKEKHGIPEAWSNPKNAINTALNRAAGKGLIATETGGRYVSAASFEGVEFENMTLIGANDG